MTTKQLGPQRLDLSLVARGLAPTRSRARDLIVRGLVTVDGVIAGKPAMMVAADAGIAVAGEAFAVSREPFAAFLRENPGVLLGLLGSRFAE